MLFWIFVAALVVGIVMMIVYYNTDVVKNLMDEAKRETRLSSRYYSSKRNWEDIIVSALRGYFDENKDMILDMAATKLVESYKRTKAFKEKMSEAMDDISKGE